MDQQTTWTGKLSLTQIPYRLCPDLQRQFVRAAMIGSRAQPLPRRVAARLPACSARLANEAIARLLTSDNPSAFDGLEDAQREARRAAERAVRVAYRKKAGTIRQRISGKIVQAIADDEHFCFTGRRGDLLDDPIPAHLATRLQVDLAARTIRLPPDGDDDQGAVWRDVFIRCQGEAAPARNRGAATPRDDDAVVAMMLVDSSRGSDFSVRDFVLSHTGKIEGNSDEAKIRRLQRKYSKARNAQP